MWMRDAIRETMTFSRWTRVPNPKYFPNRFGQCFLGMVGLTWGDSLLCSFDLEKPP
jgi:hypothetical protein